MDRRLGGAVRTERRHDDALAAASRGHGVDSSCGADRRPDPFPGGRVNGPDVAGGACAVDPRPAGADKDLIALPERDGCTVHHFGLADVVPLLPAEWRVPNRPTPVVSGAEPARTLSVDVDRLDRRVTLRVPHGDIGESLGRPDGRVAPTDEQALAGDRLEPVDRDVAGRDEVRHETVTGQRPS